MNIYGGCDARWGYSSRKYFSPSDAIAQEARDPVWPVLIMKYILSYWQKFIYKYFLIKYYFYIYLLIPLIENVNCSFKLFN